MLSPDFRELPGVVPRRGGELWARLLLGGCVVFGSAEDGH